MKKLLPILLIGVMLFSIGFGVFASPRIVGCSQGGYCETIYKDGANNKWYIICTKCGTVYDSGTYD